jgi:hypothetical protein
LEEALTILVTGCKPAGLTLPRDKLGRTQREQERERQNGVLRFSLKMAIKDLRTKRQGLGEVVPMCCLSSQGPDLLSESALWFFFWGTILPLPQLQVYGVQWMGLIS